MKRIKLTKGKYALVDNTDFEWLSQYKWHYDRGYAATSVYKPKRGIIYMHRMLMSTPVGKDVDHINQDKLDNRRDNLRNCTRSQNKANVGLRADNKTGYKGVVREKRKKSIWYAWITVNKKAKYLGSFPNKHRAALAYNVAALEHFGDFANLNIVRE